MDEPREIDRQTIHAGRKFDFERVTVRSSSGATLEREMVRHPGAAVILPILDDGRGGRRVVFVANWRFTVGRRLLELPAGGLEVGEPAIECAARELEEETGYRAASVEPLAEYLTTPGITDELMHAFLATGLTKTRTAHEEGEEIEVVELSEAEAVRRAVSGAFDDAKTTLTILLAHGRGLLGGGR